jgi:hypothetical protein
MNISTSATTKGDSLTLRCLHMTRSLRMAVTNVLYLGGAASPPPTKPEPAQFGQYAYPKEYLAWRIPHAMKKEEVGGIFAIVG